VVHLRRRAGADGGDIDAWEPLADGARWLAYGLWGVLPLALGCGVSAFSSTAAVIGLALHGFVHWLGLRDLRSGLDAVDLDEGAAWSIDLAGRIATVHAGLSGALAGLALLPCLGASIPNVLFVVAMGLLAPTFLAAVLSGFVAMLRIVQNLGIAEEIGLGGDLHGRVALALAVGGAAIALGWVIAPGFLILGLVGFVTVDRSIVLAVLGLAVGALAALPGLWMYGRSLLAFAVAAPQLAILNPAAERVERAARRSVRAAPTRVEDLPPIDLVDDSPPSAAEPGGTER
jgi:hypothetical protein